MKIEIARRKKTHLQAAYSGEWLSKGSFDVHPGEQGSSKGALCRVLTSHTKDHASFIVWIFIIVQDNRM